MDRWLLPTDIQWSEMLSEADYDFYHLPCYVKLSSSLDHGDARAFHTKLASGQLLIPLLVRELPSDIHLDKVLFDATSPYGFSGPLFSNNISPTDAIKGIKDFIEFGNQVGLISTFLRLHPVLRNDIWQTFSNQNEKLRIIHHGATVSIDLTREISQLDDHLRRNHLQNIKKLIALGFKSRIDHWEDYSAIKQIYYQTMARCRAKEYYYFNDAYFDKLRQCLPDSLHICSIISPDGEIAGAGVFIKTENLVQAHLSATADKFIALAPSKFMFYEVRNWAKNAGATMFHLGGGVGGERDSLYSFKRGFATNEHDFMTVGIIHDPGAYRKACDASRQGSHSQVMTNREYFPSYRVSI